MKNAGQHGLSFPQCAGDRHERLVQRGDAVSGRRPALASLDLEY
jgi:hypothetical protein